MASSSRTNTLSRVFAGGVQRVPCDVKYISSFGCFLVQSDRLKRLVLWIGCHSQTFDIDISKALARKIMYFDYGIPLNGPIPTVYEASMERKKNKKNKGGEKDGEGQAENVDEKDSIQSSSQRQQELDQQEAMQMIYDILHTSEGAYFELNREVIITSFPLSWNHLVPDENGNFVLVEISRFVPDKRGKVPKIDEEFKELTSAHLAVIKVGEEWDIWYGKNVTKDVAAKAKAAVISLATSSDELHDTQLFGRNVRVTREGKESVLFKAYFADKHFQLELPTGVKEENCRNWSFNLINCFIPSVPVLSVGTSTSSNKPLISDSQDQQNMSAEDKYGGTNISSHFTSPTLSTESAPYSLKETFAPAPDIAAAKDLDEYNALEEAPFVPPPQAVDAKFWINRQKSHIAISAAKPEDIGDREVGTV